MGQAHGGHNLPAPRRRAASTRNHVHNHAGRSLSARPSDEPAAGTRGITKSRRKRRTRHHAGIAGHPEGQEIRTRAGEVQQAWASSRPSGWSSRWTPGVGGRPAPRRERRFSRHESTRSGRGWASRGDGSRGGNVGSHEHLNQGTPLFHDRGPGSQ